MTRPSLKVRSAFRRRRALAAIVAITAVVGVGALTGCTQSSNPPAAAAGGTLRVGVVGTGTTETIDPGHMDSEASIARNLQIFEPLVRMGSGNSLVENVLADSLTPNADGSVWTIKLRQGVTWHDGTPLTADDVIYTINYNVDNKTWASNVWSTVNRTGLKKIDDLTLEIPLVAPNFLYPEALVDINELIIKNGTTSFDHPIGTGPFKYQSFTPGQQSTFVRNDNYWGGAPKLDAVELDSITDDNARVNALISGQVDAISSVPFSGVAQLTSAGLAVSNTPSGSWIGIRMNTQLAPFNDARVRQAMRLLVDRDQIVSNAYGGNAKIGNDLFGWFDPNFDQLPQRSYDPEKAKQLLKDAGYENLSLTLPVTNLGPGSIEMATLFAASAAKAGVTITVQQMPAAEYYSTSLSKRQWSPASWGARTIATQISNQMSQQSIDAGTSETNWEDPAFLAAYKAAISSSDPASQRSNLAQAQQRIYDDGPYIIPAFSNIVTASASHVAGLKSNIRFAFGDFNFANATVK